MEMGDFQGRITMMIHLTLELNQKWVLFANSKDFTKGMMPPALDVPGSELDDAQEEIGSEDEENNYYSMGGDGFDYFNERED